VERQPPVRSTTGRILVAVTVLAAVIAFSFGLSVLGFATSSLIIGLVVGALTVGTMAVVTNRRRR